MRPGYEYIVQTEDELLKKDKPTAYWGVLSIVPTPIGNLKDMSLWAYETLVNADIIACENAKTTGKLLHLMRERGISQQFGSMGGIDLSNLAQKVKPPDDAETKQERDKLDRRWDWEVREAIW